MQPRYTCLSVYHIQIVNDRTCCSPQIEIKYHSVTYFKHCFAELPLRPGLIAFRHIMMNTSEFQCLQNV